MARAYCGGDSGCGWEGEERRGAVGVLVTEDDWAEHIRETHLLEFGLIPGTEPIRNRPEGDDRG